MDPKHLAQFATIVELGSVTKAARRLNVTQPTLSRIVKVIEDRVGGPVLRRGRYGVEPTAIGSRLALEGQEIRNRTNRAKRAVKEWKEGLRGELRIGVGPMLASTFFGDFLIGLHRKDLGYATKIHSEPANRLIDSLIKDDLDLALLPSQINMHSDKLMQETFFTDRLAVYCSVNDPLTKRSLVTPEDLRDKTWISTAASSGLMGTTEDVLDQLGLSDVLPAFEMTGEVTSAGRFLAATQSLCIFPVKLCGYLGDIYGIVPLNMSVKLPTRDVAIWTQPDKRGTFEVDEFINLLKEFAKDAGLT
ncbi:LysR family transcriptional regulator [Phaeobacter marinintestinus]|uniref:LysR family transcriptional regulator n=1 Tax=Falsiphaeobacter marinintestinus TaxID=1492905 RepID=UPI0011B858E2|nr:LysR family transcriptional regulator [Phaeobacter marinintestinus]